MAEPSSPFLPPNDAGPIPKLGRSRSLGHGKVAKHPVPLDFQRNFLASKARHLAERLARGLNAHPDQYSAIAGSLAEIIATSDPVPGGVGYGTFYTPQFQADFSSGTDILWAAICPELPGGNVASVLYCTATNRSARGVEALAAYDPGAGVAFRIYDWSIPQSPPGGQDARWVYNLSGDSLAPYFSSVTVNGVQYRCLPIYNSTVQTGAETWTNSVSLLSNQVKWVQHYSRSYQATLADQQLANLGDWGPIVETFQPTFSGTNPLGASGVQMRSNRGGNWSNWSALSADQASIRDDNVGFRQAFLQPNHDWIVVS